QKGTAELLILSVLPFQNVNSQGLTAFSWAQKGTTSPLSCGRQCANAKQANYATLSLAFLCRNGLSVGIHGDPAGGVPKQFLHDLDVDSGGPQQGRIRMAEGVPPDWFGDPYLSRNRPYDFAHDLLSHIGSSAFRFGAGKDPVLGPVVSHLSTPCPQRFRETGVKRDGLLRRFRFAGAGHLHHDGSNHADLIGLEVDVLPLQAKQFTHSQSCAHIQQYQDPFSEGQSV